MKGKKILAMVTTLLIGTSMAACSTNSKQGDTKEKVTISVLTQSIEPTELLAKFQNENKNITVKWERVDQNNLSTVLKTRLAAGGEDLDIFTPLKADITTMAEAGTFLDITGKPYLDNYQSTAIELSKINGKSYGIPLTQQAYLVWYNKDVFKKNNLEIPKDYEEFLKVCETLKSNNIAPIALAGKEAGTVNVFAGLPYSGTFSSEPQWLAKAKKGEVKWTDEASVNALKKVKELVEKGYILDGALGTGSDQAYQAFYQGKAAMMVNGAWSIDLIIKNTPTFEYGAFAPVGNDKGTPVKVAYTAGNFMGINAKSKNKEAAEKFLSFISQSENAKLFTDTIKQFSSLKGATADFHAATKVVQPIFEMEKTQMLHADVSPSVNSILASSLQKLLSDKSVTPEQVAQQLQEAQEKDIKK